MSSGRLKVPNNLLTIFVIDRQFPNESNGDISLLIQSHTEASSLLMLTDDQSDLANITV